jgi:hypothetical protein
MGWSVFSDGVIRSGAIIVLSSRILKSTVQNVCIRALGVERLSHSSSPLHIIYEVHHASSSSRASLLSPAADRPACPRSHLAISVCQIQMRSLVSGYQNRDGVSGSLPQWGGGAC